MGTGRTMLCLRRTSMLLPLSIRTMDQVTLSVKSSNCSRGSRDISRPSHTTHQQLQAPCWFLRRLTKHVLLLPLRRPKSQCRIDYETLLSLYRLILSRVINLDPEYGLLISPVSRLLVQGLCQMWNKDSIALRFRFAVHRNDSLY